MNASADSPPFAQSVAIIGVGLMGGSIAAALKRHGFAGTITGIGRDARRLAAAHGQGLLDRWATGFAEGVRSADLIVVCTPVDRIVADVRACLPHCRPGTLLTDAGSVKQAICRDLANCPDGVTFIGSHPLAGSEKNGFEHARGDLFEGRICVITPNPLPPPNAVTRLAEFWKFLGMTVIGRTAEEHDRALAETSHLPHVAAAALAAVLGDEHRLFAATGFRDTTRIAAGDPDLWTAILLDNAGPVLESLARYAASLADFRAALENGDAQALKNLLHLAKTSRDALAERRPGGRGQ